MCLFWWNDRRSCIKVRGYVCLLVCCLPSCCRHYSLLPCRFVLVTIAQLNAHNLVDTHIASYASSSSHWPYSRWVWWRMLGTRTVLHSHLYSEVFFRWDTYVVWGDFTTIVYKGIFPYCFNNLRTVDPASLCKTQWCMLNQITLECVVNTRFGGRDKTRGKSDLLYKGLNIVSHTCFKLKSDLE